MQCYMGTPCRQQYTHPGDATHRAARFVISFFHCTRKVISMIQQLQWLTLHEKICWHNDYDVPYNKRPGSSLNLLHDTTRGNSKGP